MAVVWTALVRAELIRVLVGVFSTEIPIEHLQLLDIYRGNNMGIQVVEHRHSTKIVA